MNMNITIIDLIPLLQYPATILTCGGYYFVGSRDHTTRKAGFLVGLVGNAVWIAYALVPTVQIGLIITNVFIALFGIRGYINNNTKTSDEVIKVMEEEKLF